MYTNSIHLSTYTTFFRHCTLIIYNIPPAAIHKVKVWFSFLCGNFFPLQKCQSPAQPSTIFGSSPAAAVALRIYIHSHNCLKRNFFAITFVHLRKYVVTRMSTFDRSYMVSAIVLPAAWQNADVTHTPCWVPCSGEVHSAKCVSQNANCLRGQYSNNFRMIFAVIFLLFLCLLDLPRPLAFFRNFLKATLWSSIRLNNTNAGNGPQAMRCWHRGFEVQRQCQKAYIRFLHPLQRLWLWHCVQLRIYLGCSFRLLCLFGSRCPLLMWFEMQNSWNEVAKIGSSAEFLFMACECEHLYFTHSHTFVIVYLFVVHQRLPKCTICGLHFTHMQAFASPFYYTSIFGKCAKSYLPQCR